MNETWETEGTPTEVLDGLSRYAGRRIRASRDWPKTPSRMGNSSADWHRILREHGVNVKSGKSHKGRFISLKSKLICDESDALVARKIPMILTPRTKTIERAVITTSAHRDFRSVHRRIAV